MKNPIKLFYRGNKTFKYRKYPHSFAVIYVMINCRLKLTLFLFVKFHENVILCFHKKVSDAWKPSALLFACQY